MILRELSLVFYHNIIVHLFLNFQLHLDLSNNFLYFFLFLYVHRELKSLFIFSLINKIALHIYLKKIKKQKEKKDRKKYIMI